MRALALLPLLTLTACAIEPNAAREALRDDGFEHVETSAEPVFGRPCDWSEPYARRFVASREGKRVAGTICATTAAAHDATIRGARVVASRAPDWDSFGGPAMMVPGGALPAPSMRCIGCAPHTGRRHFRVRLRVRFRDDGSQLYALVLPSGLILLETARFGMRGYCAALLLPPVGCA